MPPVAKFSRQEMIEKAIEIIGEGGFEKLTARELAASLGTSVKSIFTALQNMEEVKQCCFDYAYEKYHSYFEGGLGQFPLKTIGLKYIEFARKDPALFQLVFLKFQEKEISFNEYMEKLDDEYEGTLNLVQEYTGLSKEKSFELYKNLWIYTTGIAGLCATKQCQFSDEEISTMLDNTYTAFIDHLKK